MSVQRIASRYAKSLLDLSVEQEKLERVNEDMLAISKLMAQRDFQSMIKSPIIQASKKDSIIRAALGGKLDDLSLGFILLLINKGRERLLKEIAIEFASQYKRFKGISSFKIISAAPLSSEQVEAITKKLQKQGLCQEKVEIETQVKEDLIGGFIVEFDDLVYDASVKNTLSQTAKNFQGNIFKSQIVAR